MTRPSRFRTNRETRQRFPICPIYTNETHFGITDKQTPGKPIPKHRLRRIKMSEIGGFLGADVTMQQRRTPEDFREYMEYVAYYIDRIQRGLPIDPITVYYSDIEGKYHVTDGAHRVAALRELGCEDLVVDVQKPSESTRFV